MSHSGHVVCLVLKIWAAEVMIHGEDFRQWTETA